MGDRTHRCSLTVKRVPISHGYYPRGVSTRESEEEAAKGLSRPTNDAAEKAMPGAARSCAVVVVEEPSCQKPSPSCRPLR